MDSGTPESSEPPRVRPYDKEEGDIGDSSQNIVSGPRDLGRPIITLLPSETKSSLDPVLRASVFHIRWYA